MKFASVKKATTSASAMNVNGTIVRRRRTRTSRPSTAAPASSANAGSTSRHSLIFIVGSSRIASGGSCLIATPKMRRPTSSAVSVWQAIER